MEERNQARRTPAGNKGGTSGRRASFARLEVQARRRLPSFCFCRPASKMYAARATANARVGKQNASWSRDREPDMVLVRVWSLERRSVPGGRVAVRDGPRPFLGFFSSMRVRTSRTKVTKGERGGEPISYAIGDDVISWPAGRMRK